MGTRTRTRFAFADNFSRGLDLFRLQALVQGRSIFLLSKIIALIAIAGVFAFTWWTTHPMVLHGAFRWYGSWFANDALLLDVPGIPVHTVQGWEEWTTTQIRFDAWHTQAGRQVLDRFLMSTLIAMMVSFPLTAVLGWAAWWRGKNATAELLSRGQETVSDHELARLVRRRAKTSSFRIGRVPIPETALNRNILFLGTTQTGKSVSLKRWLAEVERRGEMAIVFDKVGDYTERFYDEARGDVLLNPLDARSRKWSPWAEMRETADAYRLARSLIPSVQGNNSFFHTAAQDLFAALLTRVNRMPGASVMLLLKIALTYPKSSKAKILARTSAAKHFQGRDNQAGQSVDATMGVFTQSLRFLQQGSGGGEDFSIRDFITDTVTALDTDPKTAVANAIERQRLDTEKLHNARRLLASGDDRAASKNAEHVLARWPLLPKDVPPFEGDGSVKDWWRRHGEAIKAYWEAQDEDRQGACERAIGEIRERVTQAGKKGAPWLFIASNQRQLSALKPLISMQLDAVADTILSLPPNRRRRVWLIMDELASLQAIPSLPILLTECAKYGACVCVGLQNMGQLRDAYGRDTAETILSLFNTKVMFRMPEPETAAWCEKAIGQAVIERVHEGIRYGTSQTMDGAQLSVGRSTEPIVMAGDIMRQPDLHLYLMLPGDWPVGHAQLRFDRRRDAPPARTTALVPIDPTTTIFHALDALGFTPIPEGGEMTRPEELSTMAITMWPDEDDEADDDETEDDETDDHVENEDDPEEGDDEAGTRPASTDAMPSSNARGTRPKLCSVTDDGATTGSRKTKKAGAKAATARKPRSPKRAAKPREKDGAQTIATTGEPSTAVDRGDDITANVADQRLPAVDQEPAAEPAGEVIADSVEPDVGAGGEPAIADPSADDRPGEGAPGVEVAPTSTAEAIATATPITEPTIDPEVKEIDERVMQQGGVEQEAETGADRTPTANHRADEAPAQLDMAIDQKKGKIRSPAAKARAGEA